MKQQFFVGDSVRICDIPQESTHVDWTDLMGRIIVTGKQKIAEIGRAHV